MYKLIVLYAIYSQLTIGEIVTATIKQADHIANLKFLTTKMQKNLMTLNSITKYVQLVLNY